LDDELQEIYSTYGPSPLLYYLASRPEQRSRHDRELKQAIKSLTLEMVDQLLRGYLFAPYDVASDLVVLRRSDDSDGTEFSVQIVSPYVRRLFTDCFFYKWDDFRRSARLWRDIPSRNSADGFFFECYCDLKVPSLRELIVEQLFPSGIAGSPTPIDILPTDVVHVHNALPAKFEGFRPGYYQIEITMRASSSFDSFTITYDGRVIVYAHDPIATGLDDLADAMRAAGREDLIPWNSKKKWSLVSVVPERFKHLVEYKSFPLMVSSTGPSAALRHDWDSHIDQFRVGFTPEDEEWLPMAVSEILFLRMNLLMM
jgi:hypothetical protein